MSRPLVTHWRPALRMAWRDLRRHKLRSGLTMFLVALPVVLAVAAALVSHNTQWEGEKVARDTMGGADAVVEVTRFPQARVIYDGGGWMRAKSTAFTEDENGKRRPVRRDRAAVSVADLLPDGSRVTIDPVSRNLALPSGGNANLQFADAGDPMTRGLVAIESGRAPSAADEAAVTGAMAQELDLLAPSGDLRADAMLDLADGVALHVVGVLENDDDWYAAAARVLAPPNSVLRGDRPTTRYLVDLPAMDLAATKRLVADLADEGVAMMPRDVIFHPRVWHARTDPNAPVDLQTLAVGALVIGFGLIEVVLVVGSAFAVGARRQVRDLGLLAASGGAPADVRRVLLAQGLVLGVGASVLGAAAGIGLFRVGVPVYEAVARTTLWTRDIDWTAVLVVTLLGSVTGLVAAVVPAWSIGRLTPVAALSGRFPVRPGESTAHRPAFLLAGLGVLPLAAGGFWTAREFAARPGRDYVMHSPLPIAVGGLGALLLVAGTVWSAPYAVRRIAGLGRMLPLSGRFAFRDAARHRFRTAAAAITLMITVAGAVLTGFGVNAAAAVNESEAGLPANSASISLYGRVSRDDAQLARALDTTERVLGATRIQLFSEPVVRGTGYNTVYARVGRFSDAMVNVVGEDTLRYLVADDQEAAALETFRAGGLVTSMPRLVRGGEARLIAHRFHKQPRTTWDLPALAVHRATVAAEGDGGSWISEETARGLDVRVRPSTALALTPAPVTNEQLARLGVYGIDAWSNDPKSSQWREMTLWAVGAAGLLTALVAGIAVALASAEGKSDTATMAAIGAGPWRRRGFGAMHGVFLGVAGVVLGVVIGIPAGLSFTQVDGLPGISVPWVPLTATLLVVPLFAALAGWLVTPTRLSLVRRTG